MFDRSLYDQEVINTFKQLLDDYSVNNQKTISFDDELKNNELDVVINHKAEKLKVETFLANGCGCKNNCQTLFTEDELIKSRAKLRTYSWDEKNFYLLGQLYSFLRYSDLSMSARAKSTRKHQTFEYRINIDRPVCRDAFLFYYEETLKRLKRIQKHLVSTGLQAPTHGNSWRIPSHTYDLSTHDDIISFIVNLAMNHGLPNPGRDIRKGKGRLRILLPSIMNYTSVHQLYVISLSKLEGNSVGYDTFIKVWQDNLPYIVFNNPKTDLCLVCENFKKQLNQVAAILDEEKEKKQEELHQAALDHLKHAQNERLYYRTHASVAQQQYSKLISITNDITLNKVTLILVT